MSVLNLSIAGASALLVFLIGYALLVPKRGPQGEEVYVLGESSALMRLAAKIGNEFYAALPANMRRTARSHPKIEELIRKSGNPWGVTPESFIVIQFLLAPVGALFGLVFGLMASAMTPVPLWAWILMFSVFFFFIPWIQYREAAVKRDVEFKRQLPDALELMKISMSGGDSLSTAIRSTNLVMEDGALQEVFDHMVQMLDAGYSTHETLDYFADIAPNVGIVSFVRSLQHAEATSSPTIDTLSARAESSREEFFALLHEKTSQLESKLYMVLTPTMLGGLVLIVLTPAIVSFSKTM